MPTRKPQRKTETGSGGAPAKPTRQRRNSTQAVATNQVSPAAEAGKADILPDIADALTVSAANLSAVSTIVTFNPGLFAVDISAQALPAYQLGQIALPLIWLSQPPSSEHARLKILTAAGDENLWLHAGGDVVVVRVPAGGGRLTVTVLGAPGENTQSANISVRRLNRFDGTPDDAAAAQVIITDTQDDPVRRTELSLEILAHIERQGDVVFPRSGWVGKPGSRLRLEGFGIRAAEGVEPGLIEYKVFHPPSIETPWVKSPQYCGTRARGLRLTGFSVNLAPQLQGRMEVEYYGSFFDSGTSGPFRNGEPCLPKMTGDVLEAVHIRLFNIE
jgi:hypothetical protein